MDSPRDTDTSNATGKRAQTTAPLTRPTAGRRGAVRLLGLGMALLGALGMQPGAASPAPQSDTADLDVAALPKPPRGKRGRRGRKGNHGPKGPSGEPGGSGPEGPAGPSSGAFLGLVRDTADKEVESGVLGVVTLECPAAAPGERVVAVGGSFGGQVHDGNGFFITANEPTSDTEWLVAGFNTSTGKLLLVGNIVCARYTA